MDNTSAPLIRDGRARIGFALLMSLLILLPAGKSVLYDTLDPDCFWHLRVAEQLQRQGVRPIVDDISFASNKQPWTPYSWLAEIGMKQVWELGGYRAAVATQALIIAAMFLFIAMTCIEMTRHPRPYIAIALAIIFAGYLALPYLSFRPVTASCALLAACAWLIARDRRRDERTNAVWLVPVLTAINVNVHLFALIVPLWIAAMVIGALWERSRISHWSERADYSRRVRRNLVLLGFCCLACVSTPMLPGLVYTLAHYGHRDPMVSAGRIAELRPFYRDAMWPIPGAVLLFAAVAIMWRGKQFRLGEWLVLTIAALGIFRMGRLAPLLVLIAAPMLAAALPTLRGRMLGRPIVIATLAILLTIGGGRIAFEFPSRQTPLAQWLNRHGPDTPGYPCSAADFIARRIPRNTGRIINDFTWGGYLAWELGPRYQIFMDARTQLYSEQFWTETCLGDERTMTDALRAVKADAAVVPLKSRRLAAALNSLGWKRVYEDDRAAVLIPPHASVADVKD